MGETSAEKPVGELSTLAPKGFPESDNRRSFRPLAASKVRPRAATQAAMRHLLLAFALLSGCAHVDRVSYTPQPGRIVDPRAELQAFIKQNTVQGCLTEPVFEGATLDVKWVCSRALGHAMVRLDRVVSIDI